MSCSRGLQASWVRRFSVFLSDTASLLRAHPPSAPSVRASQRLERLATWTDTSPVLFLLPRLSGPPCPFLVPRNTGDWQPGLSHESAWVPPNHSMFPVRPETRTKRQILLFYLKQLAGSLRNHLWKLLIPMVEPFDQVMGGCVIKSQIAVFLSHSSHRSLTQRRNFRWSLLGNSGSSHMGPTEMSADVRSESSRNPVSLLYLGLVKNVQQKMWNKNSRPSHHKYLVVY